MILQMMLAALLMNIGYAEDSAHTTETQRDSQRFTEDNRTPEQLQRAFLFLNNPDRFTSRRQTALQRYGAGPLSLSLNRILTEATTLNARCVEETSNTEYRYLGLSSTTTVSHRVFNLVFTTNPANQSLSDNRTPPRHLRSGRMQIAVNLPVQTLNARAPREPMLSYSNPTDPRSARYSYHYRTSITSQNADNEFEITSISINPNQNTRVKTICRAVVPAS